MKCTSCNKEVTDNYIRFKCPQCSKVLIRCKACRERASAYKCECGLVGP
jgi:predicted RNA-binding Zn-ribbon protein involved in translation (DUF1610 family)